MMGNESIVVKYFIKNLSAFVMTIRIAYKQILSCEGFDLENKKESACSSLGVYDSLLLIVSSEPTVASLAGSRVPIVDRWKERACITVFVQLFAMVLLPMTVCGCHFHWIAVPVVSLPIFHGFYQYFSYRTPREQTVGHISGVLSILWIFASWGSNVQYAFL